MWTRIVVTDHGGAESQDPEQVGRLRALRHDATGFAVNAARSDAQAARRAVVGDKLLSARLRRQSRLHTQVAVVVRFRRL